MFLTPHCSWLCPCHQGLVTHVEYIDLFQVKAAANIKISKPGHLGEHDRQGQHQGSPRMDGPGFLRHCSTVSIPFVDNISPSNTYQKYNSHKLESDSTVRKIVLCETLISL